MLRWPQDRGLVGELAEFMGTMQWILDNVEGVRQNPDAVFGTIDSWLIWHLTGGERHVTDVTNASRTMLMNLETLDWDDELLDIFGIPRRMLPQILPSTDPEGYGRTKEGARITAALGDQHAATVGQVCFAPGEAKNTYGTGNFLLLNTGTRPVRSAHGLLTTVGYKFGSEPALGAAYAAGLAAGYWSGTDELRAHWKESQRWKPTWTPEQRESGYRGWRKAVERTLDWIEL